MQEASPGCSPHCAGKGGAACWEQVHGANRNPHDMCPGSAISCCKNYINLTLSCCPDGAVTLEGRLCAGGGDPVHLGAAGDGGVLGFRFLGLLESSSSLRGI